MSQSPREVVVTETGAGFAQRIEIGRHVLTTDEPESAGGTDTGPDPYGLLLAALGACTSMTLRMYAKRKGWPLESVSVRLRHEKIHARDCAECETNENSRVDRITREVSLSGSLSDEQRTRLVEIAERCPVHRTLLSPKQILTRLVSPA
ncbi:MAG TPA: OsmC family protein [Thermoanaerobaculia bacterium]